MPKSLKAQPRDGSTKSALKKLRDQGGVPAVVGGSRSGSERIQVSAKELLALLRTNPHGVIDLELPDGGREPVMISDVQKDTLRGRILHVDFRQVRMDEPVRTSVPVDLIGEAKGVREGGILQTQHYEVEIKCLPDQIPDSIRAEISHLGIGDALYASDLELPPGVELKTDPREVIVSVVAPQKDAAQEDQAEPAGTPAAADGKEDVREGAGARG